MTQPAAPMGNNRIGMKLYILSLFLLLSPVTAFAQDMGAIAGVLAAAAVAVAIPSTDDDNDSDDGE